MKNTIRLSLSLFLLLGLANSYGQSYLRYDQSKYIQADMKRTTLQIPFSASFLQNNITNQLAFSNWNIQGDASLTHESVTRKSITNIYANLNLNSDEISNSRFSGNSEITNIRANALFSSQKFLKPKVFYEPQLNFNATRNKGFSENMLGEKTRIDEVYSRSSVKLYFGLGRRENIATAWRSVMILKILDSYGLLHDEVDEDKVVNFADHIAHLITIRNPDFRLESIAEIEELYGWLLENKIVKESPKSIAVLLDAYRFESFSFRYSGYELKIGPTSNWIFDERDQITFYSNSSFYSGVELVANYYYPLSRFIQLNFYNTIAFQRGISLKSSRELSAQLLEFRSSVSFRYFLSLRTNFRFVTSFTNVFSDLSYDNLTDRQFVFTSLSANYYLSPRITLSFMLDNNFNLLNREGRTVNNHLNINFGINYIPF